MKLVDVEEMRRIEKLTDARGQSYAAMMEKAGWSVATLGLTMQLVHSGDRVLVLVGPGNNGGDGLVAAHYLREMECDVTLYVWKRDIKGDGNFSRLKRRRRGMTILWADNDPDLSKLRAEVQKTSLVIDALLGTGATRPLEGRLAELLTAVKEELVIRNRASMGVEPALSALAALIPRFPLSEALGAPPMPRELWSSPRGGPDDDLRIDEDWDDESDEWADKVDRFDEELPPWPAVPVLAVDCPSGLNCDTGALDPAAIPATMTVTFAYPKWGQVQYPGAGACGLLGVVDIGVPADLGDGLQVELVEHASAASLLPARPRDAHKGTFGKALVVGGSCLYTGAPALSGSAAARAGAGLVTVAMPQELHPALAAVLLELTWLPLPSEGGVLGAAAAAPVLAKAQGYDALLVGPGLTTDEAAKAFLHALLAAGALDGDKWRGRAIFDADALNILALSPGWQALLPPLSILTPHPGEMSRLTGLGVAEINTNRIAIARRHAGEWGHIVLLKGAHTVISHPDGRTAVLPFAEPALAKAGSGDVLAGVILAMLSQGLAPFEAAAAGAYVHGLCGTLLSQSVGPASVTARDLVIGLSAALVNLTGHRLQRM